MHETAKTFSGRLCPLLQAPNLNANPPHLHQPSLWSPLNQKRIAVVGEMGLFCGCFGRRPPYGSNSKPGYTQILEAKAPPSYSSLPINSEILSSRRRNREDDEDDEDARLFSPHLTFLDKKQPLQPNIESAAASPASSTISLPSTRVTALSITTNNTGASHLSRRSHESEANSGAPPSYTSRRAATHQRSNRSSWDRQHPVLAEEWFDQFRQP